jgi:predicted RNA polymerase sigma factor
VKYMLLLNRTADALPEPGTPELDRINQEYAADLGELVLLEDQDRGRWDRDMIAEGETVLETALRLGRRGLPFRARA